MLEKNLRIINLVEVGKPVNLDVKVEENTDMSGRYILRSTDLIFTREGEWQATSSIRLMRTNQTL